jgi:hypothetical protein
VTGFGDPAARLLIVGLAPAAHGANRTGRVFTGDSSGNWLYEALHRFGWANQPFATGRDDGLVLTDCYITAAARCAPPDNRPTREELERCRPFLEAEIALLPLGAARVAAAGLSAALLSYALSAHAWWRLLWLASGPVLLAVVTGQWAPFLTAAITIVPLRILWALKPTVGLAYWLGWPSRWAVAGGALLWAVSFAVLPDWPRYWMQAMREAPAVLAPILLPGGVLLLLALVHWRRAEARYLAALTCVPRTISLYDTVPLGLVPATRRQMLLAVALSQVALVLHVSPAQGGWTRATIYGTWYHELLFIDLPALGLMLYQGRRRAGSPSTTLSASSAS